MVARINSTLTDTALSKEQALKGKNISGGGRWVRITFKVGAQGDGGGGEVGMGLDAYRGRTNDKRLQWGRI